MFLELDRRRFLSRCATAVTVPALSAIEIAAAPPAPRSLSPGEFRTALRGPILSIPTPFTSEYQVDFDGVRRMIRRALDGGIENVSLTIGNGCYHALSYDEITRLTEVVGRSIGSRGLFIAAAGDWWTGRVVDYGRAAKSAGASALQVVLPSHADQDAQVEHFRSVAAATGLPIVLQGDYSVALLKRLVEVEAIAALKEDRTLEDYIDKQRKFGSRLTIFAGGPKYRFLVARPYGARAFYSLYSSFFPEIPVRFWKAIQANETATAYELVNKYEHPFFDRWSPAFWRASLEHFGVAQRYLRPPERSFTNEQMRDVKHFFDGLGLKPGSV